MAIDVNETPNNANAIVSFVCDAMAHFNGYINRKVLSSLTAIKVELNYVYGSMCDNE